MLILNVFGDAFDVMLTKEKTNEYRRDSRWLQSRLKKQPKTIKIIHGYGNDRPYFIAQLTGWNTASMSFVQRFSNGLHVNIEKDKTIVLHLGEIIEIGNV